MRGYQQLSRDERLKIETLREERASVRRIAARLKRQPSTILWELRRNSNTDGSYRADSAQQRARARPRGHPPGKLRPPTLSEPRGSPAWQFVMAHLLDDHWSPQVIAGRLKLELAQGKAAGAGGVDDELVAVSAETIYRFIYHPRQRPEQLWRQLYRRRAQRRRRAVRAQVRAQFMRGPGLALRPTAANARSEVGHWEADLLCFRRPGAVILHVVERLSRFRFALKLAGKAAPQLMQQLIAAFRTLPSVLRETLTVDNGSEFAMWPLLLAELGMPVFFCAPYAAWQKGTLESLNRLLRRNCRAQPISLPSTRRS